MVLVGPLCQLGKQMRNLLGSWRGL